MHALSKPKVVLLLDLFGLLLASSILNEIQPLDESANFKYYANRKGSQVVEVTGENRCHIFENGHASWIQETRKEIVTTLNYIQFQILLQKCHLDPSQRRSSSIDSIYTDSGPSEGPSTSGQFTDENDLNRNIINGMWKGSASSDFSPDQFLFNETDVSHFMEDSDFLGNSTENGTSSGTPLIFPGTRWCGRGNIARSDDDIGLYASTDSCCREHDKCSESIPAGQCRHELCNNGSYTRSHCDCDEKFLHCLQNDHSLSSLTSFKIANLYFNILKPTCFAMRHPINNCRKRRLSGECIAYHYDFQTPLTWQFFPAQPYIVRPARSLFESIYSLSETPLAIPTSIPIPGRTILHLPSPKDVPIPGTHISLGRLTNTLSRQ